MKVKKERVFDVCACACACVGVSAGVSERKIKRVVKKESQE